MRKSKEHSKLLKHIIKTGKYAHMTFEEKFWKLVDVRGPNDCWIYNGKLYSNGYGCFRMNKIEALSHRISYTITHGIIPIKKIVMHSCDVRNCVNPNHLSVGTHSDNIQDMLGKNRENPPMGENNHRCKLKDEEVLEIRKMRKDGVLGKEIAKKYNISEPQVYRIANMKRRSTI